MSLSYAQLTTPVTRDAAAADLIALLDSVGFKATSWQTTSIPFGFVMIGAHLYSKGSEFVAFIAPQAYLGQALGESLTRLAASFFQRTRTDSIPTQIRETFTTATGEGPHTNIDIGDVVVQDDEGHTYRNVAGLAVVYPTSFTSAAPVTLLMEAEVAGSDSNVADDTVTELVTTYSGVTCTNDADPVTGTSIVQVGADQQSDDTLTEACETQWGKLTIQTVKAGTINVLLDAAPGIAKVKVDDGNPRGAGTLDAYIAGEAAVSGGSDVTAAQAALDTRFFGNTGSPPRCRALAATGVPLDPTGTVYYDAGFSESDVKSAVQAAILAFVKATPLGGWDYTPGPASTVREDDVSDVIKTVKIGGTNAVKTVDLTMGDLSVGAFSVVTPPAMDALTYVPVTT